MRPVEPEEQEPERLVGWHVVEVGRRQAWPYLNLADPASGREVRLYIDATFSVEPGHAALRQHDPEVFTALDDLGGLTVMEVSDFASGGLRLAFGESSLRIEPEANELTSHSPWWLGHRA